MSKSCKCRRANRAGITILEVMFAMGVAIIGLLGIASLLPLAARNASESARASEGQALAHTWYDELIVRGIDRRANWQYFLDFKDGTTNPGFYSYSTLTTNKNSYNGAQRVLNKQAVCIDPYFLSSRDVRSAMTSGKFNQPIVDAHRWYRPAVFPYYLDAYNPVVDPAYTVSSQSTFAYTVDQPRMVRVTLGQGSAQIAARVVQQLFASGDDLAVDTEASDLSIAPTRNRGDVANTLLRMNSKGEYSWLATISPTDTLTSTDTVESALLSLVVIHKRDLVFFDPTSPPTRSGPPDIEGKPQGERMFRVVPQYDSTSTPVPFRGGHGGTVTLVASDGVSSRIHVGDWVMLAKNRTATQSVFRWFRVIATEGEAEYGKINQFDPTATATSAPDDVWARKVVLDGPDWSFDATSPTLATYIPGTVAVYERMIHW